MPSSPCKRTIDYTSRNSKASNLHHQHTIHSLPSNRASSISLTYNLFWVIARRKEEGAGKHQSVFRRKEHPSVSRARPPVGWQSTVWQFPQITTVWEWLNTVVLHAWAQQRYVNKLPYSHREAKKTYLKNTLCDRNSHVEAPLALHILQSTRNQRWRRFVG